MKKAKQKNSRSLYEVEKNAWLKLFHRCNNLNDPSYKNYGGRGIKVCKRWYKFENFIKDMGARPADKNSLDRINNNKGYSPKNCRWASWKEQNNNKQKTLRIRYKGETMGLAEWADRLGFLHSKLYRRYRRGLRGKELFNPNSIKKIRILTFNGKSQKVAEWAKELGIPAKKIRNRLNRKWPVEKALSNTISRLEKAPNAVKSLNEGDGEWKK